MLKCGGSARGCMLYMSKVDDVRARSKDGTDSCKRRTRDAKEVHPRMACVRAIRQQKKKKSSWLAAATPVTDRSCDAFLPLCCDANRALATGVFHLSFYLSSPSLSLGSSFIPNVSYPVLF